MEGGHGFCFIMPHSKHILINVIKMLFSWKWLQYVLHMRRWVWIIFRPWGAGLIFYTHNGDNNICTCKKVWFSQTMKGDRHFLACLRWVNMFWTCKRGDVLFFRHWRSDIFTLLRVSIFLPVQRGVIFFLDYIRGFLFYYAIE